MCTFLKFLLLSVSLLVYAAYIPGALSQDPSFVMKRAVKYFDDTAVPQIIGGTIADPSDWPATFVFISPQGGGCTSTAIGPKVILTAAHCIGDNAKGIVELNGRTVAAACYHHPDYHNNVSDTDPKWSEKVSPDFALCITDDQLAGLDFENIDKEGTELKLGQTIQLVGFGCNAIGGTDNGFGVLYEGNSAVQSLPTPPSYYTITLGGAAVCYGDSGGGAYVLLNPPAKARRVLMGVASRGNISTRSLLSTTSLSGFISWADSLAGRHNTKICGIDTGVPGCRSM